MSRVVITGAGVVSPIGTGVPECMHGIEMGNRGTSHMRHYDARYFPTDLSAEARKRGEIYTLESFVDRKAIFADIAMQEVFLGGRITDRYKASDIVLNLGAGIDHFDIEGYVNSSDTNKGIWDTYRVRAYTAVQKLAEKFGINGGFTVNVSACVASTQAIGLSFRQLKNVQGKAIISGGFDSMLSPLHYMGFYKLGALSRWDGDPGRACRPFDKKRCGIVLGEGAALFLLEDSVRADPSTILAEITGYSSTMDAYMVTDPDPCGEALAKAAFEAIREAGISPDNIDCVHLHETGTIKNAIAESKAMKLVFPEKYRDIPVFSLKGQVGHLIGACGALEMLAVIYSLQKQQVPPTVNFEESDPEIPLRIIQGKPLETKINYVLKLNSAFGGQNTAIVVKRYDA